MERKNEIPAMNKKFFVECQNLTSTGWNLAHNKCDKASGYQNMLRI